MKILFLNALQLRSMKHLCITQIFFFLFCGKIYVPMLFFKIS